MMITKSIGSTQTQNNFGRVLDDVTHNQTRYIIERRGVPQAVLISFADFAEILKNEEEREHLGTVLRELRPEYQLGKVVR